MVISGLQKLTLLDFPQKVACTVFLGGCNLRCPFCQNGEILDGRTAGMTEDDFFAFLKKRQKCRFFVAGKTVVDKKCLTWYIEFIG